MSRLEELRLAADKATPGPWEFTEGYYGINANDTRYMDRVANANGMADTRFIAQANPETVLALIALVEELSAALRCEWPGIADRLDGTDLQGEAVDISTAWERSRSALASAATWMED